MSETDHDQHITWRNLLAHTADILGDRVVAKWLCEHASGCDADEFSHILDEYVSQRSGVQLDAMVRRYAAGEPVQYVMGRWAFRHLDLMIDQRVLIPRPETELIVDIVHEYLNHSRADVLVATATQRTSQVAIADLGTGSGAIGLSLLQELPSGAATVWMTDASADAIDVARANSAGLGGKAAGAQFAVGEWFDALPHDLMGTFDVVVSNPPYIAINDSEVERSVNEWEPHSALFAGDDGLSDIRTIVREAPTWLVPSGLLVVEMGYTQADAVSRLFTDAGFSNVSVHNDLAGHHRFVSGIANL